MTSVRSIVWVPQHPVILPEIEHRADYRLRHDLGRHQIADHDAVRVSQRCATISPWSLHAGSLTPSSYPGLRRQSRSLFPNVKSARGLIGVHALACQRVARLHIWEQFFQVIAALVLWNSCRARTHGTQSVKLEEEHPGRHSRSTQAATRVAEAQQNPPGTAREKKQQEATAA